MTEGMERPRSACSHSSATGGGARAHYVSAAWIFRAASWATEQCAAYLEPVQP